MEKKFKAGDIAYVSVEVCEDTPADWDYNVKVSDKGGGSLKFCVNEGELFSVADFGTGIDWQATYNEYSEKAQRTIAGLSKRIHELTETVKACTESENIVRTNFTAKCDEIMVLKSENERLSKQNEELGAKVDNLEAELNSARSLNEFAVKTEQTREKLIGEQRELIKKYGMVIDILLDKIAALKKGENNG